MLLVCFALASVGLVWWILGTRGKPASLAPSGGVVTPPPGSAPPLDKPPASNLLTRDAPVSGSDLAKHDREVLEVVTAWLADAAFQPLDPQLNIMIGRLTQFTTQQAAR